MATVTPKKELFFAAYRAGVLEESLVAILKRTPTDFCSTVQDAYCLGASIEAERQTREAEEALASGDMSSEEWKALHEHGIEP